MVRSVRVTRAGRRLRLEELSQDPERRELLRRLERAMLQTLPALGDCAMERIVDGFEDHAAWLERERRPELRYVAVDD